MVISDAVVGFSIVAGIMASLLIVLTLTFEKNKNRSRTLLLWGVLFLASSFATAEYAFWLEGYNLFDMVFSFTFPLVVFFAVWFGFIIWLFESRKERKVWVVLLILLIITVIAAVKCMNCIRF